MIDRSEWSLRQRQWAEYRRWARAQKLPEYTPEDALAAAGTILEWLPASVRSQERDPEKRGVQRMHALLRRLAAG